MKIGIVFAGQGAQYSGMGKDLYEAYDEARQVFDIAGDQVKEWCFSGDKEELKQTHITQPTIYTVSMAAYRAFMAEMEKEGLLDKVEIAGVAGFSLGEYSALTAAGTIDDIARGVDIVTKRGTLMQKAGMDEDGNARGSMAAGMGDRDAILRLVEEVRQGDILEGVNFNSPKQTVVAGDKDAVKRFVKAAKENRMKAIPLKVSTAFHSPMMIPAAEALKDVLREADLRAPEMTVYADATADDMMKGFDGGDLQEYLVEAMAAQAKSPVYWEEIIRRFEAEGCQALIEMGPGKTLTGLTKKTTDGMAAYNVEDVETLRTAIGEIKNMVQC